MADIRINEQIAFLRKQRGMTQEELARALGVTNQAVSKWEQGQCCPDIGLLPDLAKMFDVSVDELLGYTPASTDEDIILDLRRKIDTLPENEDFCFAFKTAAALHTIIVSKYMIEKSSCWDTQDAIKHAVNADWGYSCCNTPKVSTEMHQGAVFFSNNDSLALSNADIRKISATAKVFSDTDNLKTAIALYRLTVHAEDAYTSVEQLSNESELSQDIVIRCLQNGLASYVLERNINHSEYRFDSAYMNLIPIISMINCNC